MKVVDGEGGRRGLGGGGETTRGDETRVVTTAMGERARSIEIRSGVRGRVNDAGMEVFGRERRKGERGTKWVGNVSNRSHVWKAT